MNIVLFTRTGFHHTYFINRLQESFAVKCVVREAYPESHEKSSFLKNLLKNTLKKKDENGLFLEKFYETYSAGFRYHKMMQDYFSSPFDVMVERPGTQYLHVRCGEINSIDMAVYLKSLRPDIIAVLGSSIIKPPIIAMPSLAMINLHSGLSPYYRGTWSYGWPLVNSEPEYIGVTLHYINPGIDTGDIIYQTRPMLDKKDDLNSIFLKLIAEGLELAVKAIKEISERGSVDSFKQPVNKGRLYLTKDFNAVAARTCLANLEAGVISGYLANKEKLDAAVLLYGYQGPTTFK